MGTGIISTSGIFGVFSQISLIMPKISYKMQGCWNQGWAWEHLPSHFPIVASNYRIRLNRTSLLLNTNTTPHMSTMPWIPWNWYMISHYRWAATGNLNQMKMTFIDSLGFLHLWKTPFFPVPETLFLGTGIELLKALGIVWGWGQQKFWGLLGFVPEFPRFLGLGTGMEPLKTFGMLWGQGTPKYRGFFGGKSPKISKFWGGGGGKNLGDFPTTTQYRNVQRHFGLMSW